MIGRGTSSPATAGVCPAPTGTVGEFVAASGIAWQPPNALHPTIPVHAPLTFDVVDRWNGRSLGGCVLRVASRRAQLRDVAGERL